MFAAVVVSAQGALATERELSRVEIQVIRADSSFACQTRSCSYRLGYGKPPGVEIDFTSFDAKYQTDVEQAFRVGGDSLTHTPDQKPREFFELAAGGLHIAKPGDAGSTSQKAAP